MTQQIPRVSLGISYQYQVHARFWVSVMEWERYLLTTQGYLPAYYSSDHGLMAASRNQTARSFLAADSADWLWLVDSDIAFSPEASSRLLAVADPVERPIVTGAYWNDFGDSGHCLTWCVETDDGPGLVKVLPPANRLMELRSCGMGCTLIHRTVFEKLAELHRDDPWPWFGHDVDEPRPGEFTRAGEDVTFCLRARKAGFKIVGHCGVVVEHHKAHRVSHGKTLPIEEAVAC